MTNRDDVEKRFDEWIDVKETLHNLQKVHKINEGEIWWCGMGELDRANVEKIRTDFKSLYLK